MTSQDDNAFLKIWQGQSPPTLRMSIDQLRSRAGRFEKDIRKRYLRDQICFGLVVACFAVGIFVIGNPITRVGCALIISWAIYSMNALRRYGSPLSAPDASEQTCVAYHRMQLERQRDIALSWPWGVGLAIPGFVLFVIGVPLNAERPQWSVFIALIAAFAFLYVALVIHGKRLAREWQREIELL